MPKHRKKKGNKLPVEPYSTRKEGDNGVTDDLGDSDERMICEKCTNCVDNLIQCERCNHWYCSKCTGLPSSVMDIIFMYKQLHWFCEACDKMAMDTILEATSNTSNGGSAVHKDVVKDIVAQVGNAIKEVNETIKITLAETLQGTVSCGLGDGANMEVDNNPNANFSYSKTTSEVITSFLDEEKERSKRRLNVILHNIEESSEDNGQARMEQDKNTAMSVFDKYMGVKPGIVKAYRIGKKRDPGPNVRPRLLKLILSSDHDKALLLRNCTKLRNEDNPEDIRRVYVTPDLTPREQQKNKALRAQLAEKNKEGKSYWIKNGKIVRRVN